MGKLISDDYNRPPEAVGDQSPLHVFGCHKILCRGECVTGDPRWEGPRDPQKYLWTESAGIVRSGLTRIDRMDLGMFLSVACLVPPVVAAFVCVLCFDADRWSPTSQAIAIGLSVLWAWAQWIVGTTIERKARGGINEHS